MSKSAIETATPERRAEPIAPADLQHQTLTVKEVVAGKKAVFLRTVDDKPVYLYLYFLKKVYKRKIYPGDTMVCNLEDTPGKGLRVIYIHSVTPLPRAPSPAKT